MSDPGITFTCAFLIRMVEQLPDDYEAKEKARGLVNGIVTRLKEVEALNYELEKLLDEVKS